MLNLLQNRHDHVTQLFIDGKIDYAIFHILEKLFISNSYLFTICLN